MYYNAGLLDRLGIPAPSPDWTFDQFLELVLQVSEQEAGEPVYGYLFEEWEDLLFAGRGVALEEEGSDPVPRAAFDSAEMLAFLEWLRDLARSQVIQVAYDRSASSVASSLSEGRIAFWPAMAGNPGDRYIESDDFPPYPVDVVPFPQVYGPGDAPGEEETPGALWNRGYYISSGSKNPSLCWDWIKYLSEQPRNLQGVPARRSVAESQAWEAVAGVEEARVFRQSVEQHFPGQYNNLTGPYFTWRHQAVLAALGDGNLRETLSDLQFKADAYNSCITQVGTAHLNYNDLLEQISACARQADPGETWP